MLASRSQLRMSFLRIALFTVPATVLLGSLSGVLSNSGYGNAWFDGLEKPSFMPPSWAFPVAWTTLYIFLGLALAMIVHARGAVRRGAILGLFLLHLALYYAWSPAFFGLHQVGIALGLSAAMILLTLILIPMLWRVRKAAALLMLPYLAWLCFAGALTWRIMADNPDASALAPAGSSTDIALD